MSHRVLCFGGRDFSDVTRIDAALSAVAGKLGPFAIIQGGARGADRLSGAWGRERGLCVIEVAAPWTFYGNGAGPLRNSWMLEHCAPTYAVGFPGGKGTADMRAKLFAAAVPLWEPFK